MRSHTGPVSIAAGATLTLAILVVGYLLLGTVPMMLFALGYLGGLVLWVLIPTTTSFERIRWPFFLTLGLFVVHKWEERHFGFFPALSKITGVPTPESGSSLAILLYVFSSAWLFIPVLVKRTAPLGYYLAWTFFASMGVTELAHFVFPLFTGRPYEYFPGMLSAIALAPAAWWGLVRLCEKRLVT